MSIKRGEIYFCVLDPVIGKEIAKTRPMRLAKSSPRKRSTSIGLHTPSERWPNTATIPVKPAKLTNISAIIVNTSEHSNIDT